MTLSIPERAVLLAAAAASPLRYVQGRGWHRHDTPVPQPVNELHVRGLVYCGYLEGGGELLLPDTCWATSLGQAAAETLRDALDPERRQMLRALDSAGELVRRERRISEQEAADVEADGDVPVQMVVEWVAPLRSAPPRVDGPGERHWVPARVCSGTDMDYLRELGLVVLLAGGTRAVITGAGRWCAEEGQGES